MDGKQRSAYFRAFLDEDDFLAGVSVVAAVLLLPFRCKAAARYCFTTFATDATRRSSLRRI